MARFRDGTFTLAWLLVLAGAAGGQERSTGLEFAGVPAINFDSDEGFGYGVATELYQYGDGTRAPYEWTLQPRLFLTSKGRRDITVFLDAPGLLPEGWRLDGFLGSEKRVKTPFYGVGNDAVYDESLEGGSNPHFYRFGRMRRSGRVTLQRRLGAIPIRALFGAGLVSTDIEPVPEEEGTTLYAIEIGPEGRTYWTNFIRAGLVWDTRDRETAPRRGTWTELLVQWVDESLGADVNFTRWTLIDRRYLSLTDRLVLAQRVLLQGTRGDPPIDQLQRIETSFKEGEGLGGATSVRGLLKNRFTGRSMFVWNAELRWRVSDFRMVGRSFSVALSAFVDQGRVWSGGVRPEEALRDLHRGYGGGLHVGMGENFVASMDVATSKETGMPIYVGLGYLY
ncbi:MAG TPA: BamA/TamA family outer membrane protein [Longimicrobiales bacterium]|nr:BamA/TamA family outer membrane protein [Longimicrobiales bacterium]